MKAFCEPRNGSGKGHPSGTGHAHTYEWFVVQRAQAVAERKARLRKIERYAPISGKQGKGVGSLNKSILLRENVQCFIRSMVAE